MRRRGLVGVAVRGLAFAAVATSLHGCRSQDDASPAPEEEFQLDLQTPLVDLSDRSGARFARVVGVGRLPAGSLVVADKGLSEVLVFTPPNQEPTVAVTRGAGPGEVQAVIDMQVFAGDSILVIEPMQLLVLDREGRLERELDLPMAAWGGKIVGMLGATAILEGGGPAEPLAEGLVPDSVWIVAVDMASGEVRARFRRSDRWYYRVSEPDGPTFLTFPPFFATGVAAVADSSVFWGTGTSPFLYRLSLQGEVIDSFHVAIPTRELSADFVAQIQDRRVREAEGDPGRLRSWVRMFEEVEFPDHLPYFDDLVVSAEGLLWLKEPPPPDGPSAVWWAHTPDGQLVRRLQVPADLELLQIDTDRVVAVQTDELDVPRVMVLEMVSVR